MDTRAIIKEALFRRLKRRFGGKSAIGDPKGWGIQLPFGGRKKPSHSFGGARSGGPKAPSIPFEGANPARSIVRSFIVKNPRMIEQIEKRNLAKVQSKFNKFRQSEFKRLGLTPKQQETVMRALPQDARILGARVNREHKSMIKDPTRIPKGAAPPSPLTERAKKLALPVSAAAVGAGGAHLLTRKSSDGPASAAQDVYNNEGYYGY